MESETRNSTGSSSLSRAVRAPANTPSNRRNGREERNPYLFDWRCWPTNAMEVRNCRMNLKDQEIRLPGLDLMDVLILHCMSVKCNCGMISGDGKGKTKASLPLPLERWLLGRIRGRIHVRRTTAQYRCLISGPVFRRESIKLAAEKRRGTGTWFLYLKRQRATWDVTGCYIEGYAATPRNRPTNSAEEPERSEADPVAGKTIATHGVFSAEFSGNETSRNNLISSGRYGFPSA